MGRERARLGWAWGGRVRCEKEGKGKGIGNGNGNGGASDQSLHIHLTSPHLTNGPWRESGSHGVKESRQPRRGTDRRRWGQEKGNGWHGMAWDGTQNRRKRECEGWTSRNQQLTTPSRYEHGAWGMAGWAWEHRESNGR